MWIYKNGRPYNTDWDDPARKEREREKWRKEFHAKWITTWRLKNERNWTDAAIRKYLGKPKKSDGYNLYARKDVEAAERNPEFVAWMQKRRARQQELEERKNGTSS